MTYESTISFTLDTICPWTFLAKRRLSTALSQVRSTNPPVTFTLRFEPYQLYPDMPSDPQDKYAWYKSHRFNGSEDHMLAYTLVMSEEGKSCTPPINYKFGGSISNTLQAHRLIQYVQRHESAEVTEKVVEGLYTRYFEREMAPVGVETLVQAATEAGAWGGDEKKAKAFVEDEEQGLDEVKEALMEQKGNGVDAVPVVIVEGKRRDHTVEGAKSVEEYVKVLEAIIKESS